jgi:molecular chaperone DnaK (HSP70)
MVKEGEQFAKEDLELMEKIESKNNLEALLYQTKSSLDKEDMNSKLESTDLETVNELLTEVETWLLDEDRSKSEYETKLNELNGQLQPILMKAMSQGSEGFAENEAIPPTEASTEATIDEVD